VLPCSELTSIALPNFGSIISPRACHQQNFISSISDPRVVCACAQDFVANKSRSVLTTQCPSCVHSALGLGCVCPEAQRHGLKALALCTKPRALALCPQPRAMAMCSQAMALAVVLHSSGPCLCAHSQLICLCFNSLWLWLCVHSPGLYLYAHSPWLWVCAQILPLCSQPRALC